MILVCDETSQKSFEDIKNHWLPEVKANADQGVKKVLLLNKMDLPNKQLNMDEIRDFAQREGMDVYETSAKTGKNVNQVFTDLCRHLIVSKDLKARNKLNESGTLSSRALNSENQDGDGGCCK